MESEGQVYKIITSQTETAFLDALSRSTNKSRPDLVKGVIDLYVQLTNQRSDLDASVASFETVMLTPSEPPLTDEDLKGLWWSEKPFPNSSPAQFGIKPSDMDLLIYAWELNGGDPASISDAFRTALYLYVINSRMS